MAATDFPGRPVCRDPSSERRMQISAVDISRAYFNASTEGCPPTYVQLPPEHPEHERGMCGFLLKHMYGTQAAADGWQQEYAGYMRELGFKQGAASPCVFVHPTRHVATSVHGDDFTSCGAKEDLDWFEDALESRYELKKGGRLGPGLEDAKEITVLNRVLRWTEAGLEYEADPRQCERLLEGLGLDSGCSGAAHLESNHCQPRLRLRRRLVIKSNPNFELWLPELTMLLLIVWTYNIPLRSAADS